MEQSRKPRVALMTYAFDNRPAKGTALVARKVTERLLCDDRFEYTLVHFDHVDDPLYAQAHEVVMPQVRLPVATRFVRTLLFFWRFRREPFDIIHWFQPRLYPFFWLAPARHIVVTMHAAGDITAARSAFVLSREVFNRVLQWFHRYLSLAFAVSQFARDEIIAEYGVAPERVQVIYNGGGEEYRPLPREAVRPMLARYAVPNEPYILNISRFQPHKNVAALVAAYNRLRDEQPERREHLVLVGTPVMGYTLPIDAVRASAYAVDIHIIPYVEQDDLNALYTGAAVFAFPSLNEGFGLPIVEAFASGTPVVTSNATSLPEIAGDAAVLVDATDERALADALGRVLSDEALRGTLRERGFARAAFFTWDKAADATLRAYASLLHNTP
jgi:glycosyltransferase involved in cell wall biosynthesis